MANLTNIDVLSFFPFLEGVPYGGVIAAVIIVIAALIVAKVFYYVLSRGVRRVTAKTKTQLDDIILDVAEKPVYLGILIAGIYFALLSLQFFAGYRTEVSRIFFVISIGWVAFLAVRIVNAFMRWYATNVAAHTKTHLDDTILPIFRKIINIFIYAIALMVVLGGFGVQITPLVASLGIAGLAIALALQSTLSNLFSGTYIASDKSIKPGDYIEIEGSIKGFVEEIGWRASKIRTLPNNIVIIPNSKLADSIITNYDYPSKPMSVVIDVGVGYGSDLEKVENVTVEVAKDVLKRVEGAVKDFEPFIRYKEFGDSNINFSVILRARDFVAQYLLKHEFIKALKKRYDKEGIEISWPVRVVHFHDEAKSKRAKKRKGRR